MGGPGGTVLVIEDDHHISDLMALYLRREGFEVLQLQDAESGLEAAWRHRPDVVFLDVGLPGEIDGLEACRRLRADGGVPVIMVSARDEEIDRVLGLELGADDYVTKPFSPRELVARTRAVLRRTAAAAPHPAVFHVGSVVVDEGRREVRDKEGEAIELTPREFDLLVALARNRGLALSRRQLLDSVWGEGWFGDDRTVDVHVRQLRKKLGQDLRLATLRGVGYRLD